VCVRACAWFAYTVVLHLYFLVVFVEVYEDHVDIRCFDMCNGAANYAN